MIRIYYLEIERIDNADKTVGREYIHNAILGVEGTLRKLIQDTTDEEHNGLVSVAVSWRKAGEAEIELLHSKEFPKGGMNVIAEIAELRAEIDKLKEKT